MTIPMSAMAGFTATTLALDASVATLAPQAVVTAGSQSGWDAANWSSRRGYVYFPTLNTHRDTPAWTRLEMLRRARYLTRNVGFAKRCTKGLSQMVGYLSPAATTDDKDWNKLAEQSFERRAGRANTFDRSGRFNVYSYQPMITSSRLTDGDFATVLTSSDTGGAMVASYEGHQIGNGLVEDTDEKVWRDGMKIIADRAWSMRLLDPDDHQRVTEIQAKDFVLNADYQSVGHSRGVTALHHAINNLLDRTEIWSDVKLGIKIANRIGYYISSELPQGARPPRAMGGKVTTETTEGGSEMLVEDIWRGGKVKTLAVGQKIQQLLDERPHPNSREFLEDLNRDIAWGVGLSPDVLWNIAKLGGASVRYVLADAQVWIEAQQQLLVDQFLHRFWVYFCAKEMKAGRLPQCKDPEWYWKVGFTPPAKLTVDIGRDGKLSIDLHRAGMLTLKRWFGSQGIDYEDELRQHVREYAMKVKLVAEVSAEMGVELDFDKVFPPAPGAAKQIVDPNGQPISSDDPDFGSPEAIHRAVIEMRDSIAELRLAA